MSSIILNTYYLIRPLLPRKFQLWLRKKLVKIKLKKSDLLWPINPAANGRPGGFRSWPRNKQFSLVITHDVDTDIGHNRCRKLMDIEESLGFRSSFNFVPERYRVSRRLRDELTMRGFEVGVHGLNHDGKLFRSPKIFYQRSKKINAYLKEWNAVGFRAPAMHHNLDWIKALNIKYDASTFDTDPFEPYSSGTKMIYPFWVSDGTNRKGYVELPYTLPQDFTLFVLMHDYEMRIWRKKAEWLANKGGMVLVNTHPDYMCIGGQQQRYEEYPDSIYKDFLLYIKKTYEGKYWHALPKEVANFWKLNYAS